MSTNNTPPSTVEFAYSCEGERTTLTAYVKFGASGIVSDAGHGIQQWNPSVSGPTFGSYSDAPKTSFGSSPTGSRGVALVTRRGAGDFTFDFQGGYQRLLDMSITQVGAGGGGSPSVAVTPLFAQVAVTSPATVLAPGNPTPVEVLLCVANKTLTDPDSGSVIIFNFVFDASSV